MGNGRMVGRLLWGESSDTPGLSEGTCGTLAGGFVGPGNEVGLYSVCMKGETEPIVIFMWL